MPGQQHLIHDGAAEMLQGAKAEGSAHRSGEVIIWLPCGARLFAPVYEMASAPQNGKLAEIGAGPDEPLGRVMQSEWRRDNAMNEHTASCTKAFGKNSTIHTVHWSVPAGQRVAREALTAAKRPQRKKPQREAPRLDWLEHRCPSDQTIFAPFRESLINKSVSSPAVSP